MTKASPSKSRLTRRGLLMPAIVLLLVGEARAVLAAEVVGAVGAANAGPTARAPNKARRALKPGDDIFFKDRIATGSGGSAQITLLDRSTLNVGENSEIVIDEFVYNPGAAGTMRAKLNRGMLRYVGGDISHGGGATVETPVVTIGIRGGIGMIGYVKDATSIASVPGVPRDFKGGTVVINSYGTMTVRNASSVAEIRRPGFAIFVDASARTIAAPVRLDTSSVRALMKTIGSREGQHGGASSGARDKALAATSAIGPTIDIPAASVSTPTTNGLDYTAVFNAGSAFARARSQDQQAVQLTQQRSAGTVGAATVTTSAAAVTTTSETTPTATTPAATTTTSATASTATTPVATSTTTTSATTSTTTPAATSTTTTPTTTSTTTSAATSTTTTPTTTSTTTSAATSTTTTGATGHDNGQGNNYTNNGHGH